MSPDATAAIAEPPTGAPPRIRVPGRARAIVDAVRPMVDDGRWPIKRVVGEPVRVEADAFTDGHDRIGCVLQLRAPDEGRWREQRMREDHDDLWRARFTPSAVGRWQYRVVAWVDPFLTWVHDLERRIDAGQDVATDLEIGAAIVRSVAASADEEGDRDVAAALAGWAERLVDVRVTARERGIAALGEELAELAWRGAPRDHAAETPPLTVDVERPLALFGAWYEMFPRSAAFEPGRHGTLRDVIERLPYVAGMGFDVLYLPPIHPIGETARKGRDNAPAAEPGDVGSPWAIGSAAGGHTSVHPDLGTLDDVDELVAAAHTHGLEIALDVAFQCSPDHPWVREHPEWFRHRPDGSIQYAENPPKKYQDILPFDFECDDWESLWDALRRVFLFWADRGVRVFRVDNPHTKPFPFWDWVIEEVRRVHPDVVMLSEAFTRPKRMKRLAKGGFSQSYTYFAWRNSPRELREYVEELASPPECDLMRPSFWPNTPDILTDHLAEGGRAAGIARLVLAATLAPSYGIYGPVYELCDFAQRPGAEENRASEKYEVRHWDRDDRWSLRHLIALVNRIRREHPALQQLRDVVFHHCDDPAHLAYSKRSHDERDVVLCVVNTSLHEERWGLVRLDLGHLGVEPDEPFTVHDLLTGTRHRWRGPDNVVGLAPGHAHVMHVQRAGHDEHDFPGFD